MRFVDEATGRQLGFGVRDVVLAGYTGRDREAVRRHVEELAAHGVPAPERVPAFYRVSRDRVIATERIDVLGPETSGEGEFLIFSWDGELWIGVGSDHTDRALERESVTKSKQLCPKVVAPGVWRLAVVRDRWERVTLRSFADGQAYQEGRAAALLDPEDIYAMALDRSRGDGDGLLVFSGTLPLLGDLTYARRFAVELADEERGVRLRVEYEVDAVDPID